ncbi:hypothetical protein ACNKHU_02175 [Shigella flexneri]
MRTYLINKHIGRVEQRTYCTTAIDEGYGGAFSSILDANITTLIKVIILSAVGTGAIKGFANFCRYRCGDVDCYRRF